MVMFNLFIFWFIKCVVYDGFLLMVGFFLLLIEINSKGDKLVVYFRGDD